VSPAKKRRPDVALAANVPVQRSPADAPSATVTSSQAVVDESSHYPLGDLHWSGAEGWMPDSLALLCRREASTAIVFVHGFAGAADSTWELFPRSIRAMREASLADAFFIDYPSTTRTVAFCAAKLRLFLLDLLREPSTKAVNGSLPDGVPRRPPAATYDKIILVGHSMGAVVARRALLDLDRDDLEPKERDRVQMLFFAPAHKGARDLGRLVESGLGLDRLPFGGMLGSLLRLRYRSVADLTKQSECLADLAIDSEARREDRRDSGENTEYLRAHVYHAENDRVVYDDKFDDDRGTNPVMEQHHRSVCKPREGYAKPVEALRRLL
jgi:pimeloyl-ACP methyl ester carboxylesterase